jgi:hypothetical protein
MNTNVLSKKRIDKVIYDYKDIQNEPKQAEPLTDDDDDDFEDDDAIEDAYFIKIHEERKNEHSIPLREYIAKFKAKHHIDII